MRIGFLAPEPGVIVWENWTPAISRNHATARQRPQHPVRPGIFRDMQQLAGLRLSQGHSSAVVGDPDPRRIRVEPHPCSHEEGRLREGAL